MGGIGREYIYIYRYGGLSSYSVWMDLSLSRPADGLGQSREGNLHGAMTKDRGVYICVCSIAAN